MKVTEVAVLVLTVAEGLVASAAPVASMQLSVTVGERKSLPVTVTCSLVLFATEPGDRPVMVGGGCDTTWKAFAA